MKDASPWQPVRSHRPPIAMIVLTITATLDCGTEVEFSTWAVGPTVKAAEESWAKANPGMASRLKHCEVVTGGVRQKRPVVDLRYADARPGRKTTRKA